MKWISVKSDEIFLLITYSNLINITVAGIEIKSL